MWQKKFKRPSGFQGAVHSIQLCLIHRLFVLSWFILKFRQFIPTLIWFIPIQMSITTQAISWNTSCLSGWTDVNCCVQTPTLFSFRPYIWWLGIQYGCHINKTFVMQMVLLFNIRNQLYSKQTFVRWLI